ncbi:MAG TPA: dynamin family protein, partial [Acidimicrobiales bacterium]|nr:dynamin family protein [Acidimicrobiales bacterium]
MTEASGGGGTRSAAIEEVKDVASETRAAAVASDRLDLVARIDARASRLDDPASRVLVVGEYKQGKSSLVNALVGSAVCPVDDDIASAVPVTVRFGDVASAALVVAARITDGATEPPTPERRSVSIEDVSRLATEAGDPGEGQRSLEVALPSEVLADGLVLVDTPGVGGLGSMEATATMGALPMADAVVFVTDASQELTGAEAIFLRQASALCPNILCALTKTDFYGAWPKMRDLDLEHLERLDLPIEVLPISSALHERARETGDPILDDESGFPQLQHALRTRVIEGAEVVAIRAAVADLHAVLSQLAGPLAAERRALVLPEALGTARREVEEARAAAKERTKQTARWQHTLADGFQDLLADVEHDLRRRFRLINQEA